MEKVPITKEGYDNLCKELDEINRVEVQKNVEEIRKAREHGDISENAEFAAAKEQHLQSKIATSQIVSMDGIKGDRVLFGCKVHITDLEKDDTVIYRLVGPYESDPKEGRISVISPIGRGIIGKEEGDIVQLKTPGGERELEITKIEVID
jgi:transcription elongation factor GreA